MATDGRNIGSELFRSLATGLASYAGAREAEKTKREQNAIQAFQAMTQMQEANRAAQEHALKMAGLQLENRARDLTLKDLLDKSRDPEGYAKKQAIIAANAQAAADEVAQRSQLQQMFGVDNGLDLLSGINSGTISLPTDSKFQLGGLTLTGAQSADPLESLKRQKLQAEIDATNALAKERGNGDSGGGSDASVRAGVNFKKAQARLQALRGANGIYQGLDAKDRKAIGVMTITSEGDLDRVLEKIDRGEPIMFGLGGDEKKADIFSKLTQFSQQYIRAGGYGPDGSFPTEEDYLAAKDMGLVN